MLKLALDLDPWGWEALEKMINVRLLLTISGKCCPSKQRSSGGETCKAQQNHCSQAGASFGSKVKMQQFCEKLAIESVNRDACENRSLMGGDLKVLTIKRH